MKTPIQKLNARLDSIIEFADISIGTAKKAFRGLFEKASARPILARPRGSATRSAYIPKGLDKHQLREANEEYHGRALAKIDPDIHIKGHTVIVPREDRANPQKIGRNSRKSAKKTLEKQAALGVTRDIVNTALHEHGHSADRLMPRYAQAGQKAESSMYKNEREGNMGAAERIANKINRVTVRLEKRANKNVLDQIQRHGTEEEAASYKKWANQQMKVGYRKPMFDDAVENANAYTLTDQKQLLRDKPYLRSRFTNLASRIEALLFQVSRK